MHDEFLNAHKWILRHLIVEMDKRRSNPDGWIEAERMAVTCAANDWAHAKGLQPRVTTADVERIEHTAMGHVDYASKLALRVAELLYYQDAPTS